ncbi:DUF1996 domain-containing protein [Actinokineospora sp. HUAS TT18]|uniref:DUF1996 domain-containing protein n=1 Tax=Actinokineospora sp. HUAS TT18 TaxID=3447451 RepID=UPI003F51F68C
MSTLLLRVGLGVALAATLATAVISSAETPIDHSAVNHAGHGQTFSDEQAQALVAQQAPVRGSEFRAECRSSHRAGNDPIVFPNRPGVSHTHEFFGNTTTNADSTLQSLRLGGTNCDPVSDKSAYWVPTLYQHGVAVAPERVTIYYQGITDPARAVPHPQGLRYVIGNALATSPDQNPAARWSCVGRPESSRDFLSCPAGSKLENYLDFPTCWDGTRLDSPNHRDHLVFGLGGAGGTCPSSHPVVLPRLEFLITYPVSGGGLSLAGTRNGVNVTTAPGYTFHGDFFNAWDPGELQRRVDTCVRGGYVCGTDGNPIQQ